MYVIDYVSYWLNVFLCGSVVRALCQQRKKVVGSIPREPITQTQKNLASVKC